MSSKRSLKHQINYICSELFAECVAASLYNHSEDENNTDSILTTIMKINAEYISRVSHPEPGLSAKAYYKDLTNNFVKQVDEVIDQISALG